MSALERIRTIQLDTPVETLKPVIRSSLDELRGQHVQLLQYPFGFIRASFCPADMKEGRYLHVWLSDDDVSGETFPHQHSCDLRSRLVSGALTNKHYHVEVDAANGDRIRKRTVYEAGRARSVPFGDPVRLIEDSSTLYTAPDMYAMQLDDIHTTHLETPVVITLIEKTRVQTDFTGMGVFPLNDDFSPEGVDLQPPTQEMLWDKMFAAVDKI